jgi:uncharacterized iron-regulated protein
MMVEFRLLATFENTMIRSTFFAAALLLTLLPNSVTQAQSDDPPTEPAVPCITSTQSNLPIEMEQLLDELTHVDVIFLGEQHDNDSGHFFQLQVIEGLASRGLNLVISTEQFERDVQGVLDDYLSGRINEEEFIAKSRPWPNYQQHYRPVIEFAREKKFPVLAANIPRRLASDVSTARPIELFDVPFMPRSVSTPEDSYWFKFEATMKDHMGADSADKLKLFYKSQCLKDDAMAESITDYLAVNSHQRKVVVHLCGHFHSDFGLGTVARVVQRQPLLRTAVVTMESIADKDKPEHKDLLRRAHYVFWSVANPPKDKATTADDVATTTNEPGSDQ